MKDLLFLALNNLKRRRLRSWLTMIGIFIGIMAVVSLISIGQGLQESISEQFETLGTDTITVIGKAGVIVSPVASELSSFPLTEKDVDIIRKVNGVDMASPFLLKSLEVEFKKEKQAVLVSGIVPDEYNKIFENSLEFDRGRQLEENDKNKLVIGYNTANKDFGKTINEGSSVRINGSVFEIIGILKKMGTPDDSSIIMTLDDLRELSGEEKIISMIFIKAKQGTNVTEVADRTENKLKDYRNEKKSEEPKTFAVSTSEQLLQAFSNVFGIVNAVLVGIAAISLLVGGVGIMNTMYTAVLERTREIGTLKAIGAKNSDVLLLFLFESGMLGLVGGAIGIALGFGISKGAEYIAATALGTGLLKASFSWVLVAGALFFSFTIGALSGVMPAIQASRLRPVDALRYE